MQLPATAPIPQAERQHAAESPKLSLLRAARRQPANFQGSWQTSNALALQASLCGSVTHRLHHFIYCGENEIQVSFISSTSVGATPTPATIFREAIQLPDCKSGVVKQSWK